MRKAVELQMVNKTMTQEEKQLLLVDLCARLPYGVLGLDCDGKIRKMVVIYPSGTIIAKEIDDTNCSSCGFKPYLRPMSSMTEEEKTRYFAMHVVGTDAWRIVNWLNERHLDYHYLIDKGLALEAPSDMYN